MNKGDRCPYTDEQLRALYNKYGSTLLLGEISGVRHSTVLAWMRRRNIPRKGAGGANNPNGYGGRGGKRKI